MEKYVRLKDPGTMFNNSETGEEISGPGARAVKSSPRLVEAIRGGALVELNSQEEVDEYNKARKITVHAVVSETEKAAQEAAKAAAEKEAKEKVELEEKEKAEAFAAKKAEYLKLIANASTREELEPLLFEEADEELEAAFNAKAEEIDAQEAAKAKGGKKK